VRNDKEFERSINPFPIMKTQLPKDDDIKVEIGDDVLIIGYPEGYYDKVTLYPTVKTGVISSGWGSPYAGMPCFMVDGRLFPGSSGSLVISKPKDQAVIKGRPVHSLEKKFAFLGVVGQYREDYNYCNVWYGSLVEDIIKNGVSWNQNIDP
jgi:hypothetical protein